jgi:hypothetical protein
LLPQYHIEAMLGHGGMGAVYKGLQPDLDRPVAIKLLPAELSADQDFVSRFKREARTLAKLHHPGIVGVYDFGQTSAGHLYFVMEYVDGTDLRRILKSPGLNPEQALELVGQICEALQAAHRQGVIHRDIKPANILLTSDGSVKLADFGLSRPIVEEEAGALTLSHQIMGTMDYMSPEQRAGQSDHRTDIYSLGVTLYEMLTGKCPRGVFVPPSRKVQLDVRIDEVVIKALQEEPDLRYQQASEMKTDVDHIRTSAIGPAAITPRPRAKAPGRWIAQALGGIALLALLLAVCWGAVFLFNRNSHPAASNPVAAQPAAGSYAGAGNSTPGEAAATPPALSVAANPPPTMVASRPPGAGAAPIDGRARVRYLSLATSVAAAAPAGENQAAALRAIATGYAKVGDIGAACDTAQTITYPAVEMAALGDIAEVQAASGDFVGARNTASKIVTTEQSDLALARILERQISAGDGAGAGITVKMIQGGEGKACALASLAAAQAGAGDVEGYRQTIEHAKAIALGLQADQRLSAIRKIAATQARAGDIAAAKETVGEIKFDIKISPMGDVAIAQAEAGDLGGAIGTAYSLTNYGRGWSFSGIAMDQAASGDFAGARSTANRIFYPSQKLSALARVAAESGDIEGAKTLVGQITGWAANPGENTRQATFACIASAQARVEGFPAAERWVQSITEPDIRSVAYVALAEEGLEKPKANAATSAISAQQLAAAALSLEQSQPVAAAAQPAAAPAPSPAEARQTPPATPASDNAGSSSATAESQGATLKQVLVSSLWRIQSDSGQSNVQFLADGTVQGSGPGKWEATGPLSFTINGKVACVFDEASNTFTGQFSDVRGTHSVTGTRLGPVTDATAAAGVDYETGFEPPQFSKGPFGIDSFSLTTQEPSHWSLFRVTGQANLPNEVRIQDDVVRSGAQALWINAAAAHGSQSGVSASFENSEPFVTIQADVRMQSSTKQTVWQFVATDKGAPGGFVGGFNIAPDNGRLQLVTGGFTQTRPVIVRDTWSHYELDFDLAAHTYKVIIDGTVIASDVPFLANTAQLRAFQFDTSGDGDDSAVVDNFSFVATGQAGTNTREAPATAEAAAPAANPVATTAPAAGEDPVIGQWRWAGTKKILTMHPDGTATDHRHGRWERISPEGLAATYQIHWGRHLDTLSLVNNGTELAGQNEVNFKLHLLRVGSAPAPAATGQAGTNSQGPPSSVESAELAAVQPAAAPQPQVEATPAAAPTPAAAQLQPTQGTAQDDNPLDRPAYDQQYIWSSGNYYYNGQYYPYRYWYNGRYYYTATRTNSALPRRTAVVSSLVRDRPIEKRTNDGHITWTAGRYVYQGRIYRWRYWYNGQYIYSTTPPNAGQSQQSPTPEATATPGNASDDNPLDRPAYDQH